MSPSFKGLHRIPLNECILSLDICGGLVLGCPMETKNLWMLKSCIKWHIVGPWHLQILNHGFPMTDAKHVDMEGNCTAIYISGLLLVSILVVSSFFSL